MKQTKVARRLFLKIAQSVKRYRQKNIEKLEKLKRLEEELKIAENIFDRLSDKRIFKIDILVRINRRLASMKEKIKDLKNNIEI